MIYYLLSQPVSKEFADKIDEYLLECEEIINDFVDEHFEDSQIAFVQVYWKNRTYYGTTDHQCNGILPSVNIKGRQVYLLPKYLFPFNIDDVIPTIYKLTGNKDLANEPIMTDMKYPIISKDNGGLAFKIETSLKLDYPFIPLTKWSYYDRPKKQ